MMTGLTTPGVSDTGIPSPRGPGCVADGIYRLRNVHFYLSLIDFDKVFMCNVNSIYRDKIMVNARTVQFLLSQRNEKDSKD